MLNDSQSLLGQLQSNAQSTERLKADMNLRLQFFFDRTQKILQNLNILVRELPHVYKVVSDVDCITCLEMWT